MQPSTMVAFYAEDAYAFPSKMVAFYAENA
jgi:hypothetical protein